MLKSKVPRKSKKQQLQHKKGDAKKTLNYKKNIKRRDTEIHKSEIHKRYQKKWYQEKKN